MSKEVSKANTGLVLIQMKGLQPSENKVYLAAQSPMIKDSSNEAIKKLLNVQLEKANIFLGQGKDVTPQDFKTLIIDPTAEYLIQYAPFVRLEELSLAIQYGSHGEFKTPGETIYLSPKKVADWVRSYMDLKKKPVMAKVANMKKDDERQTDYAAVVKDPEVQKLRNEIDERLEQVSKKNQGVKDELKNKPLSESEREAMMIHSYQDSVNYLKHIEAHKRHKKKK